MNYVKVFNLEVAKTELTNHNTHVHYSYDMIKISEMLPFHQNEDEGKTC